VSAVPTPCVAVPCCAGVSGLLGKARSRSPAALAAGGAPFLFSIESKGPDVTRSRMWDSLAPGLKYTPAF